LTDGDRGDVTVDEASWLTAQFDAHRDHLRGVAYRMLGSAAEADDAVQESWLRLRTRDAGGDDVRNPRGWLTTVVARVCLDMMRSRAARREDAWAADTAADGPDPEREAELADSVGLALLVVLDTLAPAERLAFVLHDVFAVPFDQIAPIVERTPVATRQLASRARRRIAGAGVSPAAGGDAARPWRVVEAFLAAARDGDFDALVALLDPDVVLRADTGERLRFTGAREVGRRAMAYSGRAPHARVTTVDGRPGLLVVAHGRPVATLAFTVAGDRIVGIDILADPQRLRDRV
jgi:RNA polymerase sigma-70 factor, ECF subfamily